MLYKFFGRRTPCLHFKGLIFIPNVANSRLLSLQAAKIHDEHISTNIRYDERKSNNTFLRRYKTCLRFHQRLISMCNDYNKLFSMSMFVQMLSSTSIICLTGFQAVVVRHDDRTCWSDRDRFASFETGRRAKFRHHKVRYLSKRGHISTLLHLLDWKWTELYGED